MELKDRFVEIIRTAINYRADDPMVNFAAKKCAEVAEEQLNVNFVIWLIENVWSAYYPIVSSSVMSKIHSDSHYETKSVEELFLLYKQKH